MNLIGQYQLTPKGEQIKFQIAPKGDKKKLEMTIKSFFLQAVAMIDLVKGYIEIRTKQSAWSDLVSN